MRALVDDIVTEVFAALAIGDEVPDPEQRMLEANRRYLAAYRRHGRMLEVVEEAAAGDARYRDALAGVRRDHVARVTHDIAGLQKAGIAASDVDASRRGRGALRDGRGLRPTLVRTRRAGGVDARRRDGRRDPDPAVGPGSRHQVRSARSRHDHHARARAVPQGRPRLRRERDQPARRRVGGGRHLPGARAVPEAGRARPARARVRPGLRRSGRRPLLHGRPRRGARPRGLRRGADGASPCRPTWPRRRCARFGTHGAQAALPRAGAAAARWSARSP